MAPREHVLEPMAHFQYLLETEGVIYRWSAAGHGLSLPYSVVKADVSDVAHFFGRSLSGDIKKYVTHTCVRKLTATSSPGLSLHLFRDCAEAGRIHVRLH